jgi:hypothetical protein
MSSRSYIMPDTLRTAYPILISRSNSEFTIRRNIELCREMARTASDERERLRILNRLAEEQAKLSFATERNPDDEDPGPAAA